MCTDLNSVRLSIVIDDICSVQCFFSLSDFRQVIVQVSLQDLFENSSKSCQNPFSIAGYMLVSNIRTHFLIPCSLYSIKSTFSDKKKKIPENCFVLTQRKIHRHIRSVLAEKNTNTHTYTNNTQHRNSVQPEIFWKNNNPGQICDPSNGIVL